MTQDRDIADTIAALRDWKPARVIVDHYAFDSRWHRAVGDGLGAAVLVVDDLADRDLGGRWLVDHNFHPDHLREVRRSSVA